MYKRCVGVCITLVQMIKLLEVSEHWDRLWQTQTIADHNLGLSFGPPTPFMTYSLKIKTSIINMLLVIGHFFRFADI